MISILTKLFMLSYISCNIKMNFLDHTTKFDSSLGFKLAQANFGFYPKDKTIIGKLYLADPDTGCSPIKPIGTISSPILLIRRGNCTFATKAHYAQYAGAKIALIVDNVEENEKITHSEFLFKKLKF